MIGVRTHTYVCLRRVKPKLANTQPVTIEFSEDVGEILVDNPKTANPKTQFRFYI